MWSCKRCETLNDDEFDVCVLCGEKRPGEECEKNQTPADEFGTGANYSRLPQQETEEIVSGKNAAQNPTGQKHLKVLLGIMAALLAVAVIVIIALINRGSDEQQSVSQEETGGSVVTLTAESTCNYMVNLVPTGESLNMESMLLDGCEFNTNTIVFYVESCSLINFDGLGLGLSDVEGALVRLVNLDTQETWKTTSDAYGMCDPITELSSGNYQYTVSCKGYETYQSNSFKLKYASHTAEEFANIPCCIIPEGSVFSSGFTIQLTDLDGNPVSGQAIGDVYLYTCEEFGQSYFTPTGVYIGDYTDEQGVIVSSYFPERSNLCSVCKGTMLMIVFDEITKWSEEGFPEQYIIIRAD